MNIGSCNLHVVHGAFQKGAETTGWKLKRLLKHLHFLFHNDSAHRGDIFKVTGSQQSPLLFCNVRWLESKPVVERAVNIWQNFKKIISLGKVLKNYKPGGKCYNTVVSSVN